MDEIHKDIKENINLVRNDLLQCHKQNAVLRCVIQTNLAYRTTGEWMLSTFKRSAGRAVVGIAKGVGFIGAFSLLSVSSLTAVFAAQRVVVNEAYVEVSDQSQRTQQAALKKALRQVLVKMSGSPDVLENAGVRAALRSPQSLLRSYRFSFDNSTTYYVAEFDQTKLTELLQREMLPLWGDRRPVTILWLAHDTADGERRVLDESFQSALSTSLKHTARERGVPLTLPLMDLTDTVNITTYDVWGRFVEPLRDASVRYAVDNIIGARVYKNDSTAIPELTDDAAGLNDTTLLDSTVGNEIGPDDTSEQEYQNGEIDLIAEAIKQGAAELNEQAAMAETGTSSDAVSFTDIQRTQNDDYAQTEASVDDQEKDVPDSAHAYPFDERVLLSFESQSDTVAQYETSQNEQPIMPFTMDEFANYAKRAEAGEYALDWVFIGRGNVSYGTIYGDSPQIVGKQLVEAYSNYLSSQFAVVGIEASQREELIISVANIGSLGSYANAKAYLNSLSVIETASLIEQSGTVATFSLTLVGTIDDLLNSLKLESKLKPVVDASGEIVSGQSFYWSN